MINHNSSSGIIKVYPYMYCFLFYTLVKQNKGQENKDVSV